MTQAEKDILQSFIDERKAANDTALTQLSTSKINKAPGATTLTDILQEFLTTSQKLVNLTQALQAYPISGSV